jgi:3-methyladenine DNA glycosylase/8-oxoguanine DNA glycosylase
VEAQRHLTSYQDPFTGWLFLPDSSGNDRPFYVRQRSPWKSDPDLNSITRLEDFVEFMMQVAAATATSHTRGTVARAPGDFKHAIKAVLGKKRHRNRWSKALAKLAHAYREQLLLDFECFKKFVQTNYQ